MSNIVRKTFVVGECDVPPIPPDVLCPIKANIIEACDSDNTIVLTSASTIFNKTIITSGDTVIGGTITGYNGQPIAGKILSGNTNNQLVLVDLPDFVDIHVTGGTYSNGTAIFTDNQGISFSVTGFSTGSGAVMSVQGDGVDNSDPLNPIISQDAKVMVVTATLADLGLTAFESNSIMLNAAADYLNSLNIDVPYDTLLQLEILEGEYEEVFISFSLNGFTNLRNFEGNKFPDSFPMSMWINGELFELNDNAEFEGTNAGSIAFQQALVTILDNFPYVTATLFDKYQGAVGDVPIYEISIEISRYPNGFVIDFADRQDIEDSIDTYVIEWDGQETVRFKSGFYDVVGDFVAFPSNKFRFLDGSTINNDEAVGVHHLQLPT